MAQAAAVVGLNALSTAGSTFASVEAQKAEADFRRSQLDINRRMAEIQAADAISRGEKEAAGLRTKTRMLVGSQRAAAAAGGVDVNRGDIADIQTETEKLGALDEANIKTNAYREAFGYQTQAISFGNQSAYVGLAARSNIRNTILTSGMQFAAQSARDAYTYGGKK